MIKYSESHWREFREENKITKSLFSIRVKNTWLEPIYDWLLANGKFVQYGYYANTKDLSIGYHEDYWEGKVEDISLKLCWTSARLGLPDLTVGVRSKEDWQVIRSLLRKEGLVR